MNDPDMNRPEPIDAAWAEALVEAYEQERSRFEQDERTGGTPAPSQLDLAFQADRCLGLGMLRHAVRAP